jgi:hypothetical protein
LDIVRAFEAEHDAENAGREFGRSPRPEPGPES